VSHRDLIHRRPKTAFAILAGGAALHFLLCLPLYGRRGFPEVDPVWLAMYWLWIPPLIVALIWDDRPSFRLVLAYALVTGFVGSWGSVWMVPSYKTPLGALLEMIIWGPWHLLVAYGIIWIVRWPLLLVRRFVPRPVCTECDHCILNLERAYCPRCGTPFDPRWLDPTYHPRQTHRPWMIGTIVLMLFVAYSAFPWVYRQARFEMTRRNAVAQARNDWHRGDVTWFVRRDELNELDPEHWSRYKEILGKPLPGYGFHLREMWLDWQVGGSHQAYRHEIERIINSQGGQPPDLKQILASLPSSANGEGNSDAIK
jgi:hypothetical protein